MFKNTKRYKTFNILNKRNLLLILCLIMLFPTGVFAKTAQPYDTFKEIKSLAPEFGNKPWEKEVMTDINEHSKDVKNMCEIMQKKKDKEKAIIEEKLRLQKIEEKAEKSLVSMEVPQINDYKTWMSYTAVTSTGSPQYFLLNHKKAYTDKNNFRKIGDYYCVALGSFYSTQIGDRFRITFDNGQSIKVILGDQKSDRHTDSLHQYSSSGNILEFIMGSNKFENQATINSMYPSGVKKIQKYTNSENVFI